MVTTGSVLCKGLKSLTMTCNFLQLYLLTNRLLYTVQQYTHTHTHTCQEGKKLSTMTTIKCCTKKRRQMALLCADAAGKYISHGQCTCRAGRAQSCCKNYKLQPLIIFNKNVMKNLTTVYSRYLRFYTVQLVSCSHFLKPFLPRGVLAALCTLYTMCTVLAEC